MRNTLCEFLIVIAAVAKVSCKHGLWLVARVNHKSYQPSERAFSRMADFINRFHTQSEKHKEGIIQTWN